MRSEPLPPLVLMKKLLGIQCVFMYDLFFHLNHMILCTLLITGDHSNNDTTVGHILKNLFMLLNVVPGN